MSLKVAMLSGVSRLDDAGFLFSAWNGLRSAREKMGVETTILEAGLESDPTQEIHYLVESGYGFILAVGFLSSEVVSRSAREYGSTLFAVVDAQEDEPLPQNVVRLRFRENEGAYLAGLVAARSSRTGKVGFVGGVEIPVVHRFDTGFREGVARVEGVRVIREYTDSFVSYAAGRRAALRLIAEGCDVIFHAAGAAGKGVIREVAEVQLKAIGCDIDQSFLAPGTVITSVTKRLDQVVPAVISEWLDGNLAGGQERSEGIAEGAISLAPVSFTGRDEEIQAEIDAERERLFLSPSP